MSRGTPGTIVSRIVSLFSSRSEVEGEAPAPSFWTTEWKIGLLILAVFLSCFFLPVGGARFDTALLESFHLVRWYAREHVLLCLVPAFFIAGGIAVFISQASVMKYLGARANKILAYGVASVSGSILAVCSCTVLPLFAGIYRMGAGLGPATTFLYAGPAINILAIILTARILGIELGIARAVGSIGFSIAIGLMMHLIFRKEEMAKSEVRAAALPPETTRSLGQNALYFASMVAILVFANWGKPEGAAGFWATVYSLKWTLTAIAAVGLGVLLGLWFHISWRKLLLGSVSVILGAFLVPEHPVFAFTIGVIALSMMTSTARGEAGEWFGQTWGFAKQILPLLLIGVVIAGLLLGRPGQEGLIPSGWIATAVGGNSLRANLLASVVGAFMYFATLTEVPILQGLIGNGMGKGPALALLLSGPALSLPNMLVIRSVMGTRKTVVFVCLVIGVSTIAGILYGTFFA